MTLSERIRSASSFVAQGGACFYDGEHDKIGDEFIAEANALLALAGELEGKVAVTPITLSQVEGTWSTELPRVHGVGGSPEESRARFDEALKGSANR